MLHASCMRLETTFQLAMSSNEAKEAIDLPQCLIIEGNHHVQNSYCTVLMAIVF